MPQDTRDWPEFERSLATLHGEMPEEAASMAEKDRKVRPMGTLEELLLARGAAAATYPTGTIAYNKRLAQAAGMAPEDLMAHELTHVRQLNKDGLLRTLWSLVGPGGGADTPYMQRPYEQEAFAQEALNRGRRVRTEDIELPAERGKK